MNVFHAAIAALALLAPVPAAWAQAQTAELVQVEVLEGGMTARGTYLAALSFTLADGWKTYWRAPGDAGIPPEFTWRGSRNVAATNLTWPTPIVFDQGGLRSIGYKHSLVLPIEITPRDKGDRIRLKGEVELGVCSDICVPATLRFDRDLDTGAGHNPLIAAALAERPLSAKEAGLRSASCALRPGNGGLRLTVTFALPPTGGTELVVVEPGVPEVWASEAESHRQGDVLTASADLTSVDGSPIGLDRSAIRFTVLGTKHAVDIRGCTAS